MKKIIAVFLALILLLGLCACNKNNVGGQSSSANVEVKETFPLSLLYCESDTINPYTAVTNINVQLCQLIFDPLFKVNNSFEPINCLAESFELVDKTCNVVIKNATFSDMTNVTADDVVYSFNLAKKSNTAYKAQLTGVVSCTAKDIKTVTFTLSSADPYFVNLLDFPIIKKE